MRMCGFLWAFLGLAPLAASFDVEKHLSEKLLDSLPEKIGRPARTLKEMLDEHNCLHFDKPQNWGPSETNLFKERYFPAHTALLAAAIGDADFVQYGADKPFDFDHLDSKPLPSWCSDLNAALDGLNGSYQGDLRFDTEEEVTPGEGFYAFAPESSRDQLITSFYVFEQIVETMPTTAWGSTEPQLAAELATLGPKFEIELLAEITKSMWNLGLSYGDEDAIPAGPYRQQFCLNVQQDLNKFTAKLGTLFADLRLAAKELVSTDCARSWIVRGHFPWEGLFANGDYSHWPDALRDGPTAHFSSPENEAFEALHHFGARILSETIVLQLEVTTMMVGSSEKPLDRDHLFEQMGLLVGLTGPMVGEFSELVQALDEREKLTVGDLADFITGPISTQFRGKHGSIKTTLASMLDIATAFQAGNAAASDLESETVACLVAAYRVARQLVESFATVLTLIARECPEGVQKDLFLTTLDAVSELRSHLVPAKAFMDRAESMGSELGLKVAPYEWGSFPLLSWSPLPQRPGRRANDAAGSVETE